MSSSDNLHHRPATQRIETSVDGFLAYDEGKVILEIDTPERSKVLGFHTWAAADFVLGCRAYVRESKSQRVSLVGRQGQ